MNRLRARSILLLAAWVLLLTAGCTMAGREKNTYPIAGSSPTSHWEGRLFLNSLALQGTDRLDAEVSIDLPMDFWKPVKGNVTRIWIAVVGERIYDAAGHPHRWDNLHGSTVLTPTGLPIETYQWVLPVGKLGHPYRSPLEMVAAFAPDTWDVRFGKIHLKARLSGPMESVPEGYYRIHTDVFFELNGGPLVTFPWFERYVTTDSQRFTVTDEIRMAWHLRRAGNGTSPVLRVGNPHRPKRIWTLMTRAPIRGMRGVVADEDQPYFAISNRFRYPGPLIVPRREYDLTPDDPLDFSVDYFEHGYRHIVTPGRNPFENASGHLSVSILAPSGMTFDMGSYRIVGIGPYGPLTDRPLKHLFSQYGEYQVRLTGEMTDQFGWTYDAGGTYRIWVAEPLTVSTSVKPGVPFLVGNRFSNKVVVYPPVPADITYEIAHLPDSDPGRRQRLVVRGKASNFGFYFSPRAEDLFVFQEPGEYISHLVVQYRGMGGRLFMGAQTSAGVVAQDDGLTTAHGGKWLETEPDLAGVRARDRFQLARQGKWGDLHSAAYDCAPYPIPYHSGDVLFAAERVGGNQGIAYLMYLEARDPGIRRRILSRFPNGFASVIGYLYRNGAPSDLPPTIRRSLSSIANSMFLIPVFDRGTMTDMLPVLNSGPEGLHPAAFPESRDVISYYYFAAMRPGLLPKMFIGDSTAHFPYWETSRTKFEDQFNAGTNGDGAGDVYRFHGGTVYRDLAVGVNSYSAYGSVGIIEPSGGYHNRVVAPLSEPLLRPNGADQWAFLGIDPALVAQVGNSVPLAGLVFPNISTPVSIEVTAPDGRTTVAAGRSDSLGAFSTRDSIYRIGLPGVYRARIRIDAGNGRVGTLVSSSDGGYNFYAVDPNEPSAMHVDVPTEGPWDPSVDLVLPIRFEPGLKNKRLTYSVLMPGVLMDEGDTRVEGDQYDYWFSARQFHRQFPNYDYVENDLDRVGPVDTVAIVLFLRAERENGERVNDAIRIVMRKNILYNLN